MDDPLCNWVVLAALRDFVIWAVGYNNFVKVDFYLVFLSKNSLAYYSCLFSF